MGKPIRHSDELTMKVNYKSGCRLHNQLSISRQFRPLLTIKTVSACVLTTLKCCAVNGHFFKERRYVKTYTTTKHPVSERMVLSAAWQTCRAPRSGDYRVSKEATSAFPCRPWSPADRSSHPPVSRMCNEGRRSCCRLEGAHWHHKERPTWTKRFNITG